MTSPNRPDCHRCYVVTFCSEIRGVFTTRIKAEILAIRLGVASEIHEWVMNDYPEEP